MTTKLYRMENLDCANCAAKIEAKISALPEVAAASITFATRQLRVQAEDPDALLDKMTALARSVEAEARILDWEDSHGHDHEHCHGDCGCGHGHRHFHGNGEHGHAHGHAGHEDGGGELWEILVGAGLFLAGLLLEWLLPGWWSAIPFCLAYGVLGWDVLKTAGRNILRGQIFDENFLMSLATLGALVIREFPEAAGVMLFYRLGELFEHRAVEKSRKQIMDAVDLRPEVVNLLTEEAVRVIPAGDAQVGDLLLVRPGDRIPLDGCVVSGESRVDTAPITGEQVPVAVRPGDAVISGCVNTGGQFTLRVEKPLGESMVTRILRAVENAAAGKPRMDRFITRFARIYTPAVVGLALATAVIPSLITGDWGYWVYTALSFLVMSCPCALVLSIPLAFFAGIGVGGKRGILFKGGLAIEALAGVRCVVMDKTGTLTRGDFALRRQPGDGELLRLCASCERNSTHPIAQSITAAAVEAGMSLDTPEGLEEIPGHGIRAVLQGRTVLCGNETLMARFGVDIPALPECGGTRVLAAADGKYLGCLEIADTLKPGAARAVARLHALGTATAMLTGDRTENAAAVAWEVGIHTVYARLLPEEKLERLRQLRSAHGAVMFVGDGINDAPVLAGSDVGAAMGSGADAAIEAADVVFMTREPGAIPDALEIARRTRRIAWANVIFALAIKLGVMLLGLTGNASMWMAVFADSGVAMLCVLNSVRLLYGKK